MKAKNKEGRRRGAAEAAQEEPSPESGGQGELARSEQPNDRQAEPEMSGEIPSVNTFNKITQLHFVCVCVCVGACTHAVIETVRGVYSVYTVHSTLRTPSLYYVICSTYTSLSLFFLVVGTHTRARTHSHTHMA